MTSGLKKRLIISLFLIFLIINPRLRGEVSIKPGFKLGGGASTIFGLDTYLQSWQPSFCAGIFVELNVWNRLAVAAELNFVRKGSLYRLDSDGLEYRENYLFDYLEVPVLAKYYILSGRRPEFYIYAGPSVAFNLKARLKATFDDLEETVEVDNLRGTDLLVNAGAGTALKFKPGSLILEARYSHGLKSVATEPQADIRNKGLLLLVGFRF